MLNSLSGVEGRFRPGSCFFVDNALTGQPTMILWRKAAMLVALGKHQIKIVTPGYKDFLARYQFASNEKYTVKTDLLPGSTTEADSSIKTQLIS